MMTNHHVIQDPDEVQVSVPKIIRSQVLFYGTFNNFDIMLLLNDFFKIYSH
jgi:hypothetical protein